MTQTKTYPLRLPVSLKKAVELMKRRRGQPPREGDETPKRSE
jgi:hypothetical protein